MIKVFLGGEGKNDIGTRSQDPMGDEIGVVEALLRRVRADGWRVAGAISWQSIRKYRAGAARQRADHADAHNVRALVQRAYEESCELLAFARDVDGEADRERAIRDALATIDVLGFAEEYRYRLAIVGGVVKPKLEGWILCLRGVAGTDSMSRAAVDRALEAAGIELKSTAAYMEIAETGELPTASCSLGDWLEQTRTTFARLIDGGPPSP
jgi:hypothetical protein